MSLESRCIFSLDLPADSHCESCVGYNVGCPNYYALVKPKALDLYFENKKNEVKKNETNKI